jgi:hypothetical protein
MFQRPFNDLPNMMLSNNYSAKFIIVNSKKTPIDDISKKKGVRIYDKPENFIELLMKELKIEMEEVVPLDKDRIQSSLEFLVEKEAVSGFFDSVPQSDHLDSIVLDIVSPRKRKNPEESKSPSPSVLETTKPINGNQTTTNSTLTNKEMKNEIFQELEEEKNEEEKIE